MLKKYARLAYLICLMMGLQIQSGVSCTYDDVENAAPNAGCNCNALSACYTFAYIAAGASFEYYKSQGGSGPPVDVGDVATLLCMSGGMAHCPNWDWDPDYKPGGDRTKCGLKYCTQSAMKVWPLYVKAGKDFWKTLLPDQKKTNITPQSKSK